MTDLCLITFLLPTANKQDDSYLANQIEKYQTRIDQLKDELEDDDGDDDDDDDDVDPELDESDEIDIDRIEVTAAASADDNSEIRHREASKQTNTHHQAGGKNKALSAGEQHWDTHPQHSTAAKNAHSSGGKRRDTPGDSTQESSTSTKARESPKKTSNYDGIQGKTAATRGQFVI